MPSKEFTLARRNHVFLCEGETKSDTYCVLYKLEEVMSDSRTTGSTVQTFGDFQYTLASWWLAAYTVCNLVERELELQGRLGATSRQRQSSRCLKCLRASGEWWIGNPTTFFADVQSDPHFLAAANFAFEFRQRRSI